MTEIKQWGCPACGHNVWQNAWGAHGENARCEACDALFVIYFTDEGMKTKLPTLPAGNQDPTHERSE